MAEFEGDASSVVGQFYHLCNLHVPTIQRAYIVQPKTDKKYVKNRLKKRLYHSLFGCLRGPLRSKEYGNVGKNRKRTDIKTNIWSYAFNLRQKRKYDEANRLEELFCKLNPDGKVEDGSDMQAVLTFLWSLADTASSETSPTLGHADHKLPVLLKRDSHPLLPEGPLWYGDSQVRLPHQQFYMHYAKDVFEAVPLCVDHSLSSIFDEDPGSHLSGLGLFSVKGYLSDRHEKVTTGSLFGALVQGGVNSLDMKLDLPDLPDDSGSRLLETRIPKSDSVHSTLSEDEGFKEIDHSDSGTSHNDSASDSAFEDDIWEQAMNLTLSRHYTWETLGLVARAREKPFLTEAGSLAFNQWYDARLIELHTLIPSVLMPPRVEVSERALLKDVINLMIAVPSTIFALDITDQCFTMREGVYISGVTPDTLQNLLQDFMTCGMFYHRLMLFSMPPVLDSFYDKGLIFLAFARAVRRVLQHYRAVVLALPHTLTLVQLLATCNKLFSKVRYLADLCHCNNPVCDTDTFPTGVPLLSYVYQETLESSFTDEYPMMLSLLQTASAPYLMFIQEWVYRGVFRDSYGEFSIQVNEDYLQFKDKHYWTHGYTLTSASVEESVPVFLRSMANSIFMCGKSINLLKACDPQHFMCDVEDSDLPRVALTFSEVELHQLTSQSDVYSSKMKQISRLHVLSRKERKEQAERAKRDLINKARQVATQELQRLQDKFSEMKQAAGAKKKKQLDFLKSQMETDLQRRTREKMEALQEDKEYMARATRAEEALTEDEIELERRAREEIIAYYSTLSEEAAKREQKALWKVRRAKLELSRTNFLQTEEKRWKEAMERAKTDQSVIVDTPVEKAEPARLVEADDQDLPGWARRGADEPTLEVNDFLESPGKSLPNWAVRGLRRYGLSQGDGSPSPSRSSTGSVSPQKPAGRPSTPVRRRLSDSFTVNQETEELPQKPAIQTFDHVHATTESDIGGGGEKPQIKLVQDRHATAVTTEVEEGRPHIKAVEDQHASKQSEPETASRPHLKSIQDRHANKQSETLQEQVAPKMKTGIMHSTSETQAEDWKIKNRNVHGHASEESSIYEVTVPKLKRHRDMFASKESDFTDFAIRPRIKFNPSRFASKESEEVIENKPRIKMSDKMSATKESEYVDMDAVRLKKFQIRNMHGHSSDSTIQRMLYQGQFQTGAGKKADGEQPDYRVIMQEELMWLDHGVEPYKDNYDFLSDCPEVDMMAGLPLSQYGRRGNNSPDQKQEMESYEYLPITTIIESSVTKPLQAQISLVNENVVNYFLGDLAIEEHFSALRRYLCMADGDFAEILSDLLLDKLATRPRPQQLLNPTFLNDMLHNAIRLSVNADDQYADNLGFALKYFPKALNYTTPDTLDCLELKYRVSWPLNIVITENSLSKYSKLFSFMLQLKRVVWVLKDVWQRLKRDSLVKGASLSVQFRQLHLFRQEMQHFVKVIQGYIAHQIVHVTWLEFQDALGKDVHSLEDLHDVHCQYLDNAIFRCLLNKKAASLMKVTQDIFGLILKFHAQLTLLGWQVDEKTGETVHPNFAKLVNTYKIFKEYSIFMVKVVTKLADKGYHVHLHDLVLRLNFNNYYDKCQRPTM